jgi:hypothetical protein
MPLVVKDRVRETTTTTGTGTVTLAGAVAGFQSFSAIGNANTTYYTINLPGANEWEVGIGTYTASGTTLSRDTILASSNSGSAVNFSAGTKDVFCTYPAGRSVYYDTSTNVTLNALTLSGGTANGVVYLNASKVATSGTALTFDGTNLGVGSDVGVSPTNGLTRSWGDAKRFAFMTFDASYYMEVNADAANRAINYTVNSGDGTAKHIWNLGASGTPSEQMRLNSSGLEVKQSQLIGYSSFAGIGTNGLAVAGNVGIGTNTPTAKLSAVGTPTVGALVASIPNDPNDSSVATITVGANTNGGIWGGGGFGLRIIDKTSNSGSNQIGYGLYVAAPFDGTNATGNTYALTKYGIYVDDIYSFYGINSPTTNANWGIYIKGGANNYIAGNLGIGTNAPSSALYVKRTSGNAGIYADYNGTNIGRLEAASNGNLYVGTTTGTGALILGTTANAAALELNNSGNLGLGVAPPSGSSTPGIFMSGVTNIFGSTSNGITFAANTYRDAGVFKYVSSSTASRYSQEAGAHSWLTAPSGTANDPISFTQAMTLDASGNLLVGTTTSSNRTITVGAANASIALADANGGIYFGATGTPVGSGGFGVNAAIARAGGTNFHISGSVAGDLCIAPEGTKAILFGTSASASSVTERARITSGGSLQLGSATNAGARAFIYDDRSNSANADEAALCVREDGTNAIQTWLGSGGAERARITSGGGFLVGRQAAIGSELLCVEGSNADFLSRIRNTSATTPSGLFVSYTAAAPNGTGSLFLRCDDSAATRAEIRSNGGLANYQSNNVDLSDARTKTDINPLGSYWSKIAGLEIVTYKYKDQTHDDLNIGVIAQQVEAVAPEFVDSDGFGETPEDGVPLKTIYNKDLTFAAIKALQEAMARIETLEAKIAVLESKGV